MTGSRVLRLLAVLYVLGVMGLAVAAFGPAEPAWGWLSAAPELATLPASVPLLPVVYVVGGLTWQVTGADAGGPVWVVTVVYALVFAGVGTANVLLLAATARLLGHRRLAARRASA